MIPVRSDVLDYDEEGQTSGQRQAPTMVSLHFIRSALRRRWLVCVLSAVLGMLAATTFLAVFPVVHNARASLMLAHDPETEPSRAMATDVSLLRTRTVASRTIERLGLTMTPDDFLKGLTVASSSSQLLELKLNAPSNAEAVRRLTALTSVYLQFRSDQLSAQSEALIAGMQERIQNLDTEVRTLTTRIDDLTHTAGSANTEKLSDAISQRAYVQGRIDALRQSIEDANLKNQALLSSSNVLDPPAAEVGGVKRRIALALASGLIGGAAIGCGAVLFFAIISDRLRRRADVAEALEVPVPVSVRRIAPLPKRLLRLPVIRTLDGHRTAERLRLAHAIEMELTEPGRSGRLAVLSIDNAAEVRFAVAAASADLVADGRSVVLIDLTSKGNLDGEMVRSMIDAKNDLTVLRPRGLPTLAGDVTDLRALGDEDGTARSLDGTEITLVLADLDPSVGADYLLTWTDRVIIAVTAGRSSAEMLRTAGDLVRSAGLQMRVAALLHTERTDDSSGIAGFDRPIHNVEKHDRLALVDSTVAAKAAPAYERTTKDPGQVVAHQESVSDEEASVGKAQPGAAQLEPADDELTTSEEDTTQDDEPASGVDQATEEEEAAEEQAQLTSKEQLKQLAEEQPATEHVAEEAQLAEEEQPATQQVTDQTQLADQEQPAAEKAQVAEERAGRRRRARRGGKSRPPRKSTSPRKEQAAQEKAQAEVEHEPLAPEEYVAKEEQLVTQQLTTREQPGADEELEQLADDQTVEMPTAVKLEPTEVGEQAPVEQEQAAVQKQRSKDELAIEDDTTVQMAAVEEAVTEEEFGIEDDATVQIAAVEEAVTEEEAAAVAEPLEEIKGTNGWQLFFLENPLVHALPSPEDDELDWSWHLLEEPSSEQDSDSAVLPVDDKTEPTAEPDEVPDSFVEIDADGWALYIDVYRPVYLAPAMSSEDDQLNWNWDWEWDDEPAPSSQESNGHESNGNGHDQNEAQVPGKDQPTEAGHRSSRV